MAGGTDQMRNARQTSVYTYKMEISGYRGEQIDNLRLELRNQNTTKTLTIVRVNALNILSWRLSQCTQTRSERKQLAIDKRQMAADGRSSRLCAAESFRLRETQSHVHSVVEAPTDSNDVIDVYVRC